ncbi:MAG: transposase, partial [Actinomycetia bacterium]|nr:transposase [Actinomycetes bacterium]
KQPKGLPRTIIWNQQQLERLMVDYTDHYNTHRPHRSLNQQPPLGTETPPDQARRNIRPPHPTDSARLQPGPLGRRR